MRQVLIQVPHGEGTRVLEIAARCDGSILYATRGRSAKGEPVDVVTAHLPNHQVGPLMDALDPIPDLHLAMAPQGVLTLQPPRTEMAQQVQDVSERSPIEIFVAGLQSVGSWRGFLGYAAAAGVVVWLGLITNTVFLLVAAMLIAPFAGPAMNTAIATARGDAVLLRRTLLRYVTALLVTSAVAGLFSLIFGQEVATDQMSATANISSAAVLLPLAAGAAGALNLVQSERNSLVSGAAVGMLVAASLAPPAGLLGISLVLGEWEMAKSAVFLLALQLGGINLAGTMVFRLFGLGPVGPRYTRGRAPVAWAAVGATLVALGALLAWQFGSADPVFERATIQQRTRAAVRQALEEIPAASLVEVGATFTRPDIQGQNTLLITINAQRTGPTAPPNDELEEQISQAVQREVNARGFNVTPLVDVTILRGPSS